MSWFEHIQRGREDAAGHAANQAPLVANRVVASASEAIKAFEGATSHVAEQAPVVASHAATAAQEHIKSLEYFAGHHQELFDGFARDMALAAQATFSNIEIAIARLPIVVQGVGGSVAPTTERILMALQYAAAQFPAVLEETNKLLGDLIQGLQNFDWAQVPTAIIDHIKENPGLTLLQIACLLVVFTPGLVATPTLYGLGFATEGPIAGSIAATFQSIYGTPIAFSTLQSAAMGGYGVVIVEGIIQASAANTFVAAKL